ncbi:MAG TPA: aminopeptidase P family protein [bacterium]|nr:aminopeptidase P family protein [bacterium]
MSKVESKAASSAGAPPQPGPHTEAADDDAQVGARLSAVRERMAGHDINVYLVPSADEHQNEYLPAHKQRRQAISGFTGSAGDVAVTPIEAHLFVDSRYHVQADLEVDPALIRVHKFGQAGEQELTEWLTAHEAEHGPLQVGYDPFLMSVRTVERLAGALQAEGSRLVPVTGNLVDAVWAERPAGPSRPIYALPDALTGEPVADKLARVRSAMAEAGADALVLTKLDEVAWLTNLRGGDVPYNPVFEAYLIVEPQRAICFTDDPLPQGVPGALEGQVAFAPYDALPDAMRGLVAGGRTVWLDPAGTTQGLQLLAQDARLVSRSPNPVVAMKAVKNPVEITVSRDAHLKAGAAKVRSFSQLAARLREGQRVSEADYADLLYEEYAREEGFSELSFTTIAAFGANGAIVHYGTPDARQELQPGEMLLVDSGVQILGATTDDTRTIAIGAPDAHQRERFTSVLRGHIRLALQIFPEGTTGQMLDALARSPLWNEGLDYGHGTGHGVGAYLNVHEGPQSISSRGTVPLEPGMIVSNEPGYYRTGWGGIRLENLYVVEEALGLPSHPGGKRWLRFSPLTAIPFDRTLVDWPRLTREEFQWLRDYHAWVEEQLAPRLEEPHRLWLHEACATPPAP